MDSHREAAVPWNILGCPELVKICFHRRLPPNQPLLRGSKHGLTKRRIIVQPSLHLELAISHRLFGRQRRKLDAPLQEKVVPSWCAITHHKAMFKDSSLRMHQYKKWFEFQLRMTVHPSVSFVCFYLPFCSKMTAIFELSATLTGHEMDVSPRFLPPPPLYSFPCFLK